MSLESEADVIDGRMGWGLFDRDWVSHSKCVVDDVADKIERHRQQDSTAREAREPFSATTRQLNPSNWNCCASGAFSVEVRFR